jgi:hypothetical protein
VTATDAALNKIDDVLGTNLSRKTGKLPPFPAKNPEIKLPRYVKSRLPSDSENEHENTKTLQRTKSSAQLRTDKVSNFLKGRNRGVLEQSNDLEDGVDRLTGKDRNMSKARNVRPGGVRSAPSLLAGLQRVDENPLDKFKKLPGIPLRPEHAGAANAGTTSTVRRKLASDILNSRDVASDVEASSNNVRNNSPLKKSADIPHQQRPQAESAMTSVSTDYQAIRRGILEQVGAIDNNLGTMLSVEMNNTSGLDDVALGYNDISAAQLITESGGKRRTTTEILDSLEKMTKVKQEERLKANKPKATKGTTLGTAEIEQETDEKAVERLLKFTKRFESKISAAETLAAEYTQLKNGGLRL